MKNKYVIIGIVVVLIIAIAIATVAIYNNQKDESKENTETNTKNINEMDEDEIINEVRNSADNKEEKSMYSTGKHHAEITVKNYGTIALELDADVAPITVENFAKLTNEGFYNGLTFHRIISGFMIQGGDPLGNGMGGSKEKIKGEFGINGVDNNISHVRGTISMARSQSYNSASSQFFIVHQNSTFLNSQYAAFGKVTSGMEIVDKICEDVTVEDDNGTVLKENQPIIEKITMID